MLIRMLYDWLVLQGQEPVIIEAADLLARPVEVGYRAFREARISAHILIYPILGHEELLRDLRS